MTAKIIETTEAGHIVYFSTALRCYPVDLRTLNKFRKAGYELFKAQGNSTMVLSGNRHLCVDGCKITFE